MINKLLRWLFDWPQKSEKAVRTEPNVDKVTIPIPPRPDVVDYSGMIEEIRSYFGRLYESKKYEWFKFNINHINIEMGVFYGYTKYNGVVNQTGKKAVDFCFKDGSVITTLERSQWKRYDDEVGFENAKWIGYSNGTSLRTIVFTDKIMEYLVTDLLNNCGRWIADDLYYNSLKKMVESLNLDEGEFVYQKKDSGDDYYFYYKEKYILAGVSYYVDAPFVSLGFAKPELDNKYNSNAIAIYTDTGIKVGYISEKELSAYHAENTGIIPIVMEAHYYKGKLFGRVYTFTNNKKEYHYITSQYYRLIEKHEEESD